MAEQSNGAESNGIKKSRPYAIYAVDLVAAVIILAGFYYGPAYVAILSYHPQEGDVIFQSLAHSPIVDAIEGVTESPYSHCAIVAKQDGKWIVLEAYDGVEMTPLSTFLLRGRGAGFTVYRLKDDFRKNIPQTIDCARKYLNLPYDVHYDFDDEKIYCSELIFKAYRDATGGDKLGKVVRFGDMNWRPYEELIRYIENGSVPVDREMITPRDLAKAEELEQVFTYSMNR